MPQANQRIHMIGHGHIDPVWLWTWMEGFQEIKATFRYALDRMKAYPDFCFSASSRPAHARFTFPSHAGTVDQTLRPHEIRSVRIAIAPEISVREAGLLD